MQYNTQQTRRRFPSLIPHESKKLPCMGVVFVETYRPPQIFVEILVLFVVLHNAFIFSLFFVMCLSVFHLHILMNFVLCFCRCSRSRLRLLQCKNFQVCEISQPVKFRMVANFHLRHFSSLALRPLQLVIIFPDFLNHRFNAHLWILNGFNLFIFLDPSI